MSGLSYLCGYGYGSNSDEDEQEKRIVKKPKLPVPDLSKVSVIAVDEHVDDPHLHGGRKRSFPHMRGNWATYVYIKYPENDIFSKFINKLLLIVQTVDESCQRCDDIHVSVSRTFVLKYHFVSPFTTSLQQVLKDIKSFHLGFDFVKVYCNDEGTRTFVALEVDHTSYRHLLNITRKIDEILQEYNLPKFYENPSFHSSILWVNGNKKDIIEGVIDQLNDTVAHEIDKALKTVSIIKVNCKSGNKYFQYCLKENGL